MQSADFYEVLGVDRQSAPERITQAYRRLARQYHPDLHPDDRDAEQRFKAITEAYEVLSNPEKREQYDRQLAASTVPQQTQPASTSTTPGQDGSGISVRHSVTIRTVDGNVDLSDVTKAMQEATGQMADQLREALRDLGAQLGDLSRGSGGQTRNRANRRRFPPPPPRHNPHHNPGH
jgi:DnaJ-class molecular chaperone